MIRKMAFIGHPTRDLERAKHFYGDVLGLEHSIDFAGRWSEFMTPEGKTIALDTFTPEVVEHPSPYLALESDDIEADMARLKQAGVHVIRDVWTNEDDEKREICRMAVVLDPEGNPIMLHQTAAWRMEGEGG